MIKIGHEHKMGSIFEDEEKGFGVINKPLSRKLLIKNNNIVICHN